MVEMCVIHLNKDMKLLSNVTCKNQYWIFVENYKRIPVSYVYIVATVY